MQQMNTKLIMFIFQEQLGDIKGTVTKVYKKRCSKAIDRVSNSTVVVLILPIVLIVKVTHHTETGCQMVSAHAW